jgi:hypothetical protein
MSHSQDARRHAGDIRHHPHPQAVIAGHDPAVGGSDTAPVVRYGRGGVMWPVTVSDETAADFRRQYEADAEAW